MGTHPMRPNEILGLQRRQLAGDHGSIAAIGSSTFRYHSSDLREDGQTLKGLDGILVAQEALQRRSGSILNIDIES